MSTRASHVCVLGVVLAACGADSGAAHDAALSPTSDDAQSLAADATPSSATEAGAAVSMDATLTDSGAGDADPRDAADTEPTAIYTAVAMYEATIPGHGDPANIYYPMLRATDSPPTAGFPMAIFLQGANVGRDHYAPLSRALAAHGFIVVVADHKGVLGLFTEQQQVIDGLAFLRAEATRTASPVHALVDIDTLVLLGHSFGGVTALGAITGTCNIPFCSGSYTRPPQLVAAALFGTNMGDNPAPLASSPVAVALIQGSLDGKALPAQAAATYAALDGPRALFHIAGANHYGSCDVNNPEGAAADANTESGDHAALLQVHASAAAWFLRATAAHDAAARRWLETLHGMPTDTLSVDIAL